GPRDDAARCDLVRRHHAAHAGRRRVQGARRGGGLQAGRGRARLGRADRTAFAVRAVVVLPLLALAACAEPPRVAPPPVSAPPPPPVAAPAPAAPPLPWAMLYLRSCNGSITPPRLSPDGATVGSCGALFDVERGRFLGRAPFGLLALLPGNRALVDEY